MHQTDEPIEYPDTTISGAEVDKDGEGLDTEGHSLSSADFNMGLARERDREAAKYARDEALRHQVAKPRKSIRQRFLGR